MNFTTSRRGAVGAAVKSLAGVSLVAAFAGKVPAAFAQPAAADSSVVPDAVFTAFVLPDGLKGPDGKMHDSIVPSNFVVPAGVPATLKFVNYDGGKHSITVDSLGLQIVLDAGVRDAARNITPTVTTATITVPEKGTYRWDCDLTCDGGANDHWAMSSGFGGDSQEGYMAGYIVAI